MNGTVIAIGSGDMQYMDMCSDGAGYSIICWYDTNGYDVYAQKIDSTGVVQWTANGVNVTSGPFFEIGAKICYAGMGKTILVWQTEISSLVFDIRAQQLNSEGDVLWGTPGIDVCNIADIDMIDLYIENIDICSDEDGGAIMVWTDYRGGATSNLYAQRLDSSGTPQWAANGTEVCSAVDDQLKPIIISDGAGGAIIVWEDSRDFGTSGVDLYAQRLDSHGNIQWGQNGAVISTHADSQQLAQMCSDGAGGAIVVWQDARTGD